MTVGVMLIGLDGAIGSTVVAGTELMVRGAAPRVGMLTETARMPSVEGGASSDGSRPRVADALGLPALEDLRWTGWDVRTYSVGDAVRRERIVRPDLASMLQGLDGMRPLPAIRCEAGVPICGHGVRSHASLRAATEAIRSDIRAFREATRASEIVLVDITPTTPAPPSGPAHLSLEAFERAIDGRDPSVTANMLYFYAACEEGCGFVNFTPNSAEVPSLAELALKRGIPTAGRDGKTGQTFVKTALAPALRERHLRVRGWFSHNILGNADGKALADPSAAATKIASKVSVLDSILGYPVVSEAGEPTHVVTIHYYPPRGDEKESWDTIDLEGFLGESLQLKLNFLCKDSILAAPLVLDLVRLTAHAKRRGERGPLDYLSMFFKSPVVSAEGRVIHDFFAQQRMFERYLRTIEAEHARGRS